MKSKKVIIEKENKDLREKMIHLELQLGHAANQISILENNTTRANIQRKDHSPDPEFEINDLDDSQDFDSILNIVPEQKDTIANSIQKLRQATPTRKTPKKSKGIPKSKPGVEYVFPKQCTEETNLFIDLNSILVSTMNMTLPIILESVGNPEGVNEASFISYTPDKALDHSMGDQCDDSMA